MEFPTHIRLNPTDQSKIYDAIDAAKVNEKYLTLRVNSIVKNNVKYNFFQYDFNIHPEFFFGIHKFGTGTFAVWGNPISHEGKKLYPEVGFEDLKDKRTKTVMSIFKQWIALIHEQQSNHERNQNRNAINKAKQILYNNPSFAVDIETAEIIIELQSKIDQMKNIVDSLINQQNELTIKIEEQFFSKQEVIDLLNELKSDIEHSSKKINIGKVLLNTFTGHISGKLIDKAYDKVNEIVDIDSAINTLSVFVSNHQNLISDAGSTS